MELNYFKVGICIKALMIKVNFMDLDSIIGKMEVIIKVNSKKVLGVVMESGRRTQAKVINMKDSLVIIKKKDTVFILGDAGIFIKEITRII